MGKHLLPKLRVSSFEKLVGMIDPRRIDAAMEATASSPATDEALRSGDREDIVDETRSNEAEAIGGKFDKLLLITVLIGLPFHPLMSPSLLHPGATTREPLSALGAYVKMSI